MCGMSVFQRTAYGKAPRRKSSDQKYFNISGGKKRSQSDKKVEDINRGQVINVF